MATDILWYGVAKAANVDRADPDGDATPGASVEPSSDPKNSLTIGSDGKLFVPHVPKLNHLDGTPVV